MKNKQGEIFDKGAACADGEEHGLFGSRLFCELSE